MLTDSQKFFTGRLCGKSAVKCSLNSLPSSVTSSHHKCTDAVLCETSTSETLMSVI